jgi:glutamate--cysteine ligase catalytic subunit
MGLLKVGHPLTWDASKPHLNYIRHHGVQQFLNTWRRVRGIKNDTLKYGDEIEVGIFVIDKATGKLRIALRSHEVILLL